MVRSTPHINNLEANTEERLFDSQEINEVLKEEVVVFNYIRVSASAGAQRLKSITLI